MFLRRAASLLLPLSFLAFPACGSSASDGESGGGGGGGGAPAEEAGAPSESDGGADAPAEAAPEAGPAPTIPFACPGGTIQPGNNTGFQVGGASRSFYADFPADRSKPMGVVFSWHGFGDSAGNFRSLGAALDPDADADFPFVVVTPESNHLFPPAGLEWALFASRKGDDNADAALFEGVLGCLAAQEPIDTTRVYSVGFSAGAIFTNSLHARYPELLAATVAFSGAWFDDPAETAKVNTLGFQVSYDWEPLGASHVPGVLLTHGGPSDAFSIGQPIINFDDEAKLAIPFLTAAGRTIVECTHNGGHQPPANLSMSTVRGFLKANVAGQAASPYASGALAGWPSTCKVVP